MNKITKGVIAGAAGVLLLSGGAGTFAAWNNSVSLGSGSVNTGTLKVTATGSGSWTDTTVTSTHPTATTIPNISNFLLVPGDSVEYKTTISVSASGDHLEGTLGFTNPTITADNASDFTVTITPDFSAAGASGTTDYTSNFVSDHNGGYTVTPQAGNADFTDIPVTVDISFDADNTDDQGKTIDFSTSKVTLTQILPSAQ